MKKLFLIILPILFLSCNENLDPYGDLNEKYILNCIIRGDTTFQTATLTRTYSVLNNDPYSSTIDPNVSNAKIRIWNGDSLTILRDTIIPRPQPSKYTYPYKVYYTNHFLPDLNYDLEIEVLLQNGGKIRAHTTPPQPIKFTYISKNIPLGTNKSVSFTWNDGLLDQTYVTRLSIYYTKKVDGIEKFMIKEIPIRYEMFGDNSVPIYPTPTNNNFLTVQMDIITKSMESISIGDDKKDNYEIIAAFLEVIALDKNLSTYFNSTARNKDAFSVKLDETDFSNVEKGFGIFGIYMKENWVVPFTPQYIRSFGYKPGAGYVDYPFE